MVRITKIRNRFTVLDSIMHGSIASNIDTRKVILHFLSFLCFMDILEHSSSFYGSYNDLQTKLICKASFIFAGGV